MSRRFQFSLKLLLAAPAYIGLVIAAFLAKPDWVAIFAIRLMVLASFGLSVGMLIVGGRYARSFAGGAIFPLVAGALWAVKPMFDAPLRATAPRSVADRAFVELAGGRLVDLHCRAAYLLLGALLSGLMAAAAGIALSRNDPGGN